MVEKIMIRRQVAAPLLPALRVEKQQQQAGAFPPLPAVVLVSLWGLVSRDRRRRRRGLLRLGPHHHEPLRGSSSNCYQRLLDFFDG
jgi:hypothetical protein